DRSKIGQGGGGSWRRCHATRFLSKCDNIHYVKYRGVHGFRMSHGPSTLQPLSDDRKFMPSTFISQNAAEAWTGKSLRRIVPTSSRSISPRSALTTPFAVSTETGSPP